ncbi:MAG: hypothetical protein LBM17_08030 [Candidatus Accumulibacter sp.]|jgi:hypothetical protein|nr:hypothetical protein [Accumulibacter sp.]
MNPSFLAPPQEAAPYCWLIEIGSTKLGVHRRDGWCAQLDERLIFFDSEEKCMLLMPILEIEAEKFLDFLKRAELHAPAYSNAIRRFPKALLLKHVFHTAVSGYWIEKALAWLVDDGALQSRFSDELEKIIDKKIMPQAVRQKARKIVKSLRDGAKNAAHPHPATPATVAHAGRDLEMTQK